jgi:hypothetical protein
MCVSGDAATAHRWVVAGSNLSVPYLRPAEYDWKEKKEEKTPLLPGVAPKRPFAFRLIIA